MRAYSVKYQNSEQYRYKGGIEDQMLVLADDFTSALMTAQDGLERLRSRLEEVHHPLAEDLRITLLREEYAAVEGNVAFNESQINRSTDWVKELADKYKKNLED